MAGKILVVDDDPETINFLSLLLKSQGYTPVAAVNGNQALKLAHQEIPDLIILDVMMPDIDGFEVARSLRGHPETATIPILMFTAKSQMQDKVSGYEAGVDIYLTKPVHPVELQANIKALLMQHQTRAVAVSAQGYVIGVMAAKGGLGVSTLALNLAIAYHKKHGQAVVAAELRPGQGSWAQELGIHVTENLTNLLCMDTSQITQQAVNEQIIRTPYDIRLLLASNAVKESNLIAATPQFDAILQALPALAPIVILDVGTHYHPAYESIVQRAQEMILVTEPQPFAVRRTRMLVDDLRARGYGSSKVMNVVVFNRLRADMSLSMTQIEDILGMKVALGIPPAAEQAYNAFMHSIPILMVQPDGIMSQQYARLAEIVAQHVPK